MLILFITTFILIVLGYFPGFLHYHYGIGLGTNLDIRFASIQNRPGTIFSWIMAAAPINKEMPMINPAFVTDPTAEPVIEVKCVGGYFCLLGVEFMMTFAEPAKQPKSTS